MWREIGRWKVKNPDGNTEIYTLHRSDSGNFKIQNDFGNIQIELEEDSAWDFIRDAKRLIGQYADKDEVVFSSDEYDMYD
tara:strand:- start:3495 stop:3734 length:240 start_codon:yes stop_codon:yes gene_type:complete